MRRAEYLGGAGRLSVDGARLLFVCAGQHPAVQNLEAAASSEHPGRALATVVAQAGFDLTPFVFARVSDRLQGIVYGPLQLRVDDGNVVTVDGATADPWAHFDASTSSVLTFGDAEFDGALWVGLGVVSAGSFRWARFRDGPDGSEMPEPASPQVLQRPRQEPSATGPQAESESAATGVGGTATAVSSATIRNDPPLTTPDAGASVLDALNVEFDATIDAIRFAEIHSDGGGQEERPSRRRRAAAASGSAVVGLESEAEEMESPTRQDGDDQDATVDLGPGQLLIDGVHMQRRTVEALVCLECENPNPPAAVRCRYCAALLSSTNTEVREVPQPVLGVIHLSGGREELLDADLVIGRKPAYLPLDRYQRAVVHAEHDRTVSRRHMELRLNQWKVMAINLKKTSRTTLESRDGRRVRLLPGIPQQLRSGDTVYYGDAWLRFEPEE